MSEHQGGESVNVPRTNSSAEEWRQWGGGTGRRSPSTTKARVRQGNPTGNLRSGESAVCWLAAVRPGSACIALHRANCARIPAIFTFRFLTGEPPSGHWAIRLDGATSDLAHSAGERDGKDADGAGGAGRRPA